MTRSLKKAAIYVNEKESFLHVFVPPGTDLRGGGGFLKKAAIHVNEKESFLHVFVPPGADLGGPPPKY